MSSDGPSNAKLGAGASAGTEHRSRPQLRKANILGWDDINTPEPSTR